MNGLTGWLLIAGLGLALAYACGDTGNDQPTPVHARTAAPRTIVPRLTPSSTPPPTAAGSGTGVIEGSLRYPSSGRPPELIVCAYEIDTGETVCTDERIEGGEFLYGYGFRLVLRAGRYELYEAVPGRGEGRGYYTEFSRCGDPPPPSCPRDHTRIVITVDGGETIAGINPGDWDPSTSP